MFLLLFFFFFFKQKTAYEMRISDWSSDVCSSDLNAGVGRSDRFGLFGGLGFAGLALAPARFLLIAAETMLGRGFAKTFLRRSGLGGLAWQRRKRVTGLRSHFGCEIAAAGRAPPDASEGSVLLAERERKSDE